MIFTDKTISMSQHPSKRRNQPDKPDRQWLFGRHAVAAAILNPNRKIRRIAVTKNAADWFAEQKEQPIGSMHSAHLDDLKPGEIDKLLPPGSVHQGMAAEVLDLPRARLKEICPPNGTLRPVVVLDQITDPQNIGAIFRSSAAFGARAIIVQDRRTPPLSGALAKAATGAVESLPCVRAVNIARSIGALQELGYHCVGLAGQSNITIKEVPSERPVALVLGAEGAGLRKLVAESCDQLCRIEMTPMMESINVSNAAAITLYELTRSLDLKSL